MTHLSRTRAAVGALSAIGALGALTTGSSAWAATVQLKLEVPRLNVAEYHRPYIAVWVEKAGESGPAVAQLAVWYDIKKQNNAGTKWLKDMRQWWRQGGRSLTVPADGVTAATRAPGEQTLSFDTHPALAALPPGKYDIVVESSREAGGREVVRLPLTWPIKAAQSAKVQGEHELGALELTAKPLNDTSTETHPMKLLNTKIAARLAPLALAAALLPMAAHAHMTWLLPNKAAFDGKEPVASFDAAVSEDLFNFERALKLDTLRITAPDGKSVEAENRSSARHRESFDVKLTQDGTYRISNISQSMMGSYKVGGETKRFRGTQETFAKEVPAGAEITALTVMTNRQQTFVSKEEAGKVDFAPEGNGLEFLPLGPVTDLSHGDKTKFRLVLDGKPAADVQLKLIREGNRYRYKFGEVELKTDAKGEFTVEWTEPGRYFLGASAGPARGPNAPAGTREAPVQRASVSATFEVLPK